MGQLPGGAHQNQGVAFYRRHVSVPGRESYGGQGGLLNQWPVQVGQHQGDSDLSLLTYKMGTTQNTSTQDPEVPMILKKNKGGRHTLPDLKAYYKPTVIRIVWYYGKDRHTDQRSGTESPEVNAHMCQAVLNKDVLTVQWGKAILFSKWFGEIGCPHAKE